MDNKIPHILIVDDDVNLLGTLRDILKMKGFEPVIALTGAAALAQLEDQSFELALVDLRLDDISGLKVLSAIKARSPETECILLTGHASQDTAIEAIRMGVYGYFQKPFDMEQVLLSIQRALEKTAAGKALRESERFARATVDALSAHLAILDETGVILAVNHAWREFAKANSTEDHHLQLCEGANYLTVCDNTKGKDSEEASAMSAGIRVVMSGRQKEFSLEYLCHSFEGKRWFTARVTRFPGEGALRIVVAHENITERKLAEEKTVQTEKRFRSLIENAPDGVVLVGLDGKYKYASSAARRIFGYGAEEDVADSNPAEQTHPEDLSMVLNVLQDLIENPSKVPTLQYRFKHKDESWRWVESTFTNLLTEPSTEAIVINFHDITERKQAQEAQRQSELQFQSLFKLSPDAVILIDPHAPDISWPIIDCNEAACQMNGYHRDELIGHSIDIVNTTPGAQAERDVYLERLREAGNVKLETFHRHKNGTVFPVEVSTSIIMVGSRELLIGIDRDITQRKQAEDDLRQSEQRFQQLANNIQETFWITDAESGKELYISPAAEKVWGIPVEDLYQGMYLFLENILLEDKQIALDAIERQLRGEKTETEYRIQHSNGSVRWIWDRAFPILDETGRVLRVAGITADITERKQAEEALQESEQKYRLLFDEMLSGVAVHEILCDRDGKPIDYRFIAINAAFEKMTGLVSAAVIGRTVLEVMPATESLWIERYGQVALTRIPIQFESYSSELGKYFEVRAFSPEKGKFATIFNDITERKKAEDRLVSSETRYRRLFEAARDGILILDADTGVVLNVNPFLVEMLGIAEEEILGKELWELGFFKDIAANKANFLELQRKEYIRYEDLPLETAQGKRFNVEFVSNVYYVNRGKVVQCNIRDITERKQAKKLIIEQSQQLKLLYEASQRLNRTLDLHEIYQAICNFMSTIASNDGLVISAFDPKKQLITCRAYWMENNWLDVSSFPSIPLEAEGKGTQNIVIRTGQSMLINDYQTQIKTAKSSYYVNSNEIVEELPAEEEEITRSALIVPLKIGGLVSGAIQVMSYRLNAYTENQLKLLEALALHIASAEQNALLYAQVQAELNDRKQAEKNIRQHVKELELLYQTGLVFSQLLNPREIAQKVIELLGEKLDWHHTAIRLVRGQGELELVAFDQPGQEDKTAVESRFKNLITNIGEGLSGWALQQSKTIRLGDVDSDPHYIASYPDLHSGLYVPLKSGNRMVGVISIESKQFNAFSEADEQLLTTLANQAANAFENARLYEETNRYAQELEQRVEERTSDLSIVNADLARAVRVKDEFLASMSHELRTPLTGILGLSEVLQLKIYGDLNEKQRTTLKNIEESGRHLLELINDILDLSKIEAGKLDFQFGPYSVGDICQASLQLIKGMAQHKHQLVNYSPLDEPIIIRADARRLKQVLVNLLSNAIKFTPENGELGLEVQADESERKIRLTVWDKGIGIRPEDMNKLFKPFTQLDSGLAREYSGTGLGLSLVRHLTELHNGGIEVESTIGQGSRFTVILPWSPENTTPIPYNMVRHGNTGGLNLSALFPDHSKAPLVMYVDDNEMVLQMVGDFLEAQQYRVIKVRNGSELLERAAETHPDIMLVDIQMPGIGGMETIRRIRAHSDPLVAAAPVIAVTALAMPNDREHCLRAGANDYMSKPLKLKELAAAIQKLLERKQ